MSKRRNPHEWVWLKPNVGFVGESNKLRAEIQPETEVDRSPCIFDCGDNDCREWATLFTEEDENKKRYGLYHVSECRMLDEPHKS